MTSPLPPADPYLRLRFLPRGGWASRRRVGWLVDGAYVADVALLLLMFFILSSFLVRRPGIQVSLPDVTGVEGLAQPVAVITLTQEDSVFFNDERTTLDGLPEAFRRDPYPAVGLRVLIEADGAVRHQDVARVAEMARQAGAEAIALGTRLPPEMLRLP